MARGPAPSDEEALKDAHIKKLKQKLGKPVWWLDFGGDHMWTMTLDDWAQKDSIPAMDLLWLDMQGYEEGRAAHTVAREGYLRGGLFEGAVCRLVFVFRSAGVLGKPKILGGA